MITKKDLKANSANAQFIRYHGVTEKDIEVVNETHDLIISSRDKTRPVPGDIIICCSDRIRYETGVDCFDNLPSKSHAGVPILNESTRFCTDSWKLQCSAFL